MEHISFQEILLCSIEKEAKSQKVGIKKQTNKKHLTTSVQSHSSMSSMTEDWARANFGPKSWTNHGTEPNKQRIK